jgi:hypothetical protein
MIFIMPKATRITMCKVEKSKMISTQKKRWCEIERHYVLAGEGQTKKRLYPNPTHFGELSTAALKFKSVTVNR